MARPRFDPEGFAGPLLIPSGIVAAMIAHCRREAPRECCGLLGGVPPRVGSFHPLRNIAPSAETRYDADPHDLAEALIELRRDDTEILAIYHSHPRWEAVPSRTDLAQNYYGAVPRIIISLLTEPPDVRVWRLGRDDFQEIPWTAVADDALHQPAAGE